MGKNSTLTTGIEASPNLNKHSGSSDHSFVMKLAPTGILWFSFCYMLLFYAPLEVYLTNTTEFWFDMKALLPVTLMCFGTAFLLGLIINLILYAIFHKKHEKIYITIQLIVLGLFLGLYVQGTYIPREYGVLNGAAVDWKAYPSYAVASVIVWICAAVFSVLIGVKFRKYAYKVFLAVGSLVFLMETVALVSLFMGNDVSMDSGDDNIVVTDYGEFQLSSDKNVYVLVLDTFDSSYLYEILNTEDGDYYKEMLSDFTYYPNTLGGYPTTRASLPLILTGKWYENDKSFTEFINEAYEDDALTSTLVEEGYSVGVYTHSGFMSKEVETYINVMNGEYQISDYNEFCTNLYSLVMFEYVPHQLKSYFLVDTNSFDLCKEIAYQDTGAVAFSNSMTVYYDELINKGFSLDSENSTFHFVHLSGMHQPYIFGEDVVQDGNEYTYIDATKGNLAVIKALIDGLKEAGVYDDTAIIIMSDHGETYRSEMSSNPLFLVKGFNEKHEFEISNAPVSYVDINDALCLLVKDGSLENAAWNHRDIDDPRRFIYYSWDDSWNEKYLPTMTEYNETGFALGESLFVPTGEVYIPGINELNTDGGLILNADSLTDLKNNSGTVIDIPIDSNDSKFNDFCIAGISNTDSNGCAWTQGYYTMFKIIPSGGFLAPYVVTVSFDDMNNPDNKEFDQFVYVMVNNEKRPLSHTNDTFSFELSFNDLNCSEISILIFYPYAQPLMNDGDDAAFLISGITIGPKYLDLVEGNLDLDFSKDISNYNVEYDGWVSQEVSGIWSDCDSSIYFWSGDENDLRIDINTQKLADPISTSLYVNNQYICDICSGEQSIDIPKEYLNPLVQEIEFYTPDAVSPSSLTDSEDNRVLGIHVSSIIISEN